ncbi:hypothetical protein J4714_11605 [Staphylococcus epidermidis]|nr:hypothetical protein [Staphylococcus epidermidis]
MVAEGSIDASELNAIKEYLFGDSNDLDVTAEVTSNYVNTSKKFHIHHQIIKLKHIMIM